MKDWFLRYSQREQLALLLMAGVVLVYLLLMFVLLPLRDARHEMRQRNEATAQVLVRVDLMAAELEQLRAGDSASRAPSGNLTARLNSSADRQGLQISRLQPNGRGAVQLRFESAPLEPLLRWLYSLEVEQGMLLEELSLGQTSTAGIVSASLRVAAPN